ncbi:hypothetical protein [Hymenobacter negativus]|uniref:Uncharacterized protein n=1 Tax=Hymenobacter negativus TaxID=2795026 RepID=A0ABS0Q6A1_9BACT|nr:hypothetical protein [Hymenobacter negativus]MBH8558185.1 hypothetical protein [Hymenobacter negativus]
MNTHSYKLLVAGGLLLLCSGFVPATPRPASSFDDTPAEIQRKAARERAVAAKKAVLVNRTNTRTTRKSTAKINRAVLILLGLEANRKVTSPAKLEWHMHQHQKQLKRQALHASQARKRRCNRALN